MRSAKYAITARTAITRPNAAKWGHACGNVNTSDLARTATSVNTPQSTAISQDATRSRFKCVRRHASARSSDRRSFMPETSDFTKSRTASRSRSSLIGVVLGDGGTGRSSPSTRMTRGASTVFASVSTGRNVSARDEDMARSSLGRRSVSSLRCSVANFDSPPSFSVATHANAHTGP